MAQTNSSFLVVQVYSGVDTVNTVESHLKIDIFSTTKNGLKKS